MSQNASQFCFHLSREPTGKRLWGDRPKGKTTHIVCDLTMHRELPGLQEKRIQTTLVKCCGIYLYTLELEFKLTHWLQSVLPMFQCRLYHTVHEYFVHDAYEACGLELKLMASLLNVPPFFFSQLSLHQCQC